MRPCLGEGELAVDPLGGIKEKDRQEKNNKTQLIIIAPCSRPQVRSNMSDLTC
jgi:hypothetical protein